MRNFLILSLLLAVSMQFGCAREEPTTQAAGEPVLTDNDLERQVESQMRTDPRLVLSEVSIDADADQNMVTLSGTVESQAQKDSAAELARQAHPGLIVKNEISVEPREIPRSQYTENNAREQRQKAEGLGDKVGDSIDDAWIHAKITTKLIGDGDTPAHSINVDVTNNVVTLRGTVDTMAEKAEAERLAKETDGVRRVNNQLKVK